MTREINGRIVMRVSNDGARCAAECPHRDGGYGHCTAFDKPLVLDLGHGAYDRCPTCIAAEQAAASVPSWQPIETAPRDGTRIVAWVDGQNWRRCEVILWWRPSSSADARWHRDAERTLAVSGTPTHWMPLPEAPGVPASAQSGHLDGGARALDASEALREARVQGMREARQIVRVNMHIDTACADILRAIEAVRKGER